MNFDTWPGWIRPIARWYYGMFIAVDQLICAFFGGYPDETISSYLHRLDVQGKPAGRILRPVVDWLWFWQDDHCHKAYLSERARYHLPPILRNMGP